MINDISGMADRFTRYFKSADMLAQPLTMTLDGRSSMKTVFGSAMTIAYGLCMLAYVVLSAIEFMDVSRPRLLKLETDDGIYDRIDFKPNSNLFPVIYIFKNDNNPVKTSDIYKYITPVYIKKRFRLSADFTGKISTTAELISMPVVPCKQLKAKPDMYRYYEEHEKSTMFKNFALNGYGLCIEANASEAYVAGGGSDPLLEIISLEIFPCTLLSGCATEQEMSEIAAIVAEPTYSLNYSNSESPLRSTLTTDNFFYLNTYQRQKYSSRLAQNQLIDDRGPLMGSQIKNNFTNVYKVVQNLRYRNSSQLSCNMQQMLSDQCDPYAVFDYWSSSRKNVSVRSYKSLLVALSELGGFGVLLYAIFYCINAVYMKWAKKHLLNNAVFESLKPSKSLDNSSKMPTEFDDRLEDVKSLEARSYQIIEGCLDFATLVRDLCVFKSLVSLVLKGYHTELAPYALLASISETPNKERICKLINRKGSKKQNALRQLNITQNLKSQKENVEKADYVPELLDLFFIDMLGQKCSKVSELLDNKEIQDPREPEELCTSQLKKNTFRSALGIRLNSSSKSKRSSQVRPKLDDKMISTAKRTEFNFVLTETSQIQDSDRFTNRLIHQNIEKKIMRKTSKESEDLDA